MHRRPRVFLGPVVVALASVAFAVACASTETDIPADGEKGSGDNGSSTSSTLPPSNPPKTDSGTGSTSSSGGSSSGGTKADAGTSSGGSSGSSGSGMAPACSFSGDFTKLIAKAAEIQAGAPCDATCNPTTHCCLDLGLGGGGGASGGLPIDAGAGGGGGGGLPTGGVCVSNN